MKIRSAFVLALFAAAFASPATAARFYAQPSIAFAEVPDFKAKVGPSFALGVIFAEKHALEIEGSSFDTVAPYNSDFKLQAIPVTLNYRYEFPISARVSGSIGLSLGATRQEADYTFVYYSYNFFRDPYLYPYDLGAPSVYKYTATDDAFTAGFLGGLSFKMNDHFALTLGAKALRSTETELVRRGTMLVGQLGLTCRW